MAAERRLYDVARERLEADRARALEETREVLDHAADDFVALLRLELPDVVRDKVVCILRATAGLEGVVDALAEGHVHEDPSHPASRSA